MSFIHTFRRYLKHSCHFLLPSLCLFCRATLTVAEKGCCDACYADLPRLPDATCSRCRVYLAEGCLLSDDITFRAPQVCGQCLKKSPSYDTTFALFDYAAPIIQCMTALKFGHQLIYANFFAHHLASQIQSHWYRGSVVYPDWIIPVPLSNKRLRLRGFNQALEIVKPLARQLGLPVDMRGITRIKETTAQTRLSAQARRINLKNAFALTHRVDYTGLCVAILDDVMTTGATVENLAYLLKKNGAKIIHIWCCARRG